MSEPKNTPGTPPAPARSKSDTVREFYVRMDAGREDVFEMISEDFEFYFPKFGCGRGRADLEKCTSALRTTIRSLKHDQDSFRFVEGADSVALEGLSVGETVSGRQWSGGATPGGRFCCVFDFRGPLITRLYTYLDPDYGGEDAARLLWGHENRRW
jgi:hypothetical protein